MENLTGKWGGTYMYTLSPAEQLEDIHPDDVEKLMGYTYIRSLHECIADNGNFITIAFGDDYQFRVKRSIFIPVNIVPQFKPFEKVKFMNTKGVLEFGEIRGVHWHNNNRIFYYDVMVNEIMKGRRYYEEDLELL
ncbi:hypothetical protein [Niastella sp. OAS944]|uniref:hypothetical protein n=1 Tax=Niastella sp. OAS944 TaxID=2664089 RepID=UPI00347A3479|nr:hypothetical protein [Chitinophagaceae bacterium OAS944]